MKKLMLIATLALMGCNEQQQQHYQWSQDREVQIRYNYCVEHMLEDCCPEVGMTVYQINKLRTLETGDCRMKLDWRHSDGMEQWSERINHLRIVRIYVFTNDTLDDWTDIPIPR